MTSTYTHALWSAIVPELIGLYYQNSNTILLADAFGFFLERRYYELGPNDPPYAAKFYDCCGAEDPGASGCTTSFHVSYDDAWCNLSLLLRLNIRLVYPLLFTG